MRKLIATRKLKSWTVPFALAGALLAAVGYQAPAEAAASGAQYVFYLGSNGHMYEAFYTGSWTALDQCAVNAWGCSPSSAPGVGVS